MLSKRSLKLRSFNGVAGGETATVPLPMNVSLHQIDLTFGGDLTVAKVNGIRYIVNGEIQESWKSGTQRQTMNSYLKLASSTTKLQIPFERLGCLSLDHRELTVVGTGLSKEGEPNHISSHSLELDIDASSATPSISGKIKVSGAAYTNLLRKTRHFTFNPQAAGEFEIHDFPRQPNTYIDRIWIKTNKASDSSVTELVDAKLTINNRIDWQRTNAQNEDTQIDGQLRTPQAGYYVIDFAEEGDGDEYLECGAMETFLATLNFAEAATAVISVEYLSTLESKF